MENQIKIFENEQFGSVRIILEGDSVLFCGADVAKVLGYSNPRKAMSDHCKGVTKRDTLTAGGKQSLSFISESDLYRLAFGSKLPSAEKFTDWVADEVLPTIRKTGGYVNNEDAFINTYLPFADENTKTLFRATLSTVRQQNELIEQQKRELIHKEDVIVGLVENIDLATKRQRITQIVRHNSKAYADRYNLLYSEFEKKYHCDLSRRMESEEANAVKPKIKNKMDYIDRVMGMIPQLYEITCKIFENDVSQLMDEWNCTICEREVV